MYIHLAVLVGRIERTFHQMLFQRGTAAVFVLMELQQSFRKRTVIQARRFEQCGNHSFVISGGQQRGNIFTGCFLACGVQVIVKSKLLDFLEECFLKT